MKQDIYESINGATLQLIKMATNALHRANAVYIQCYATPVFSKSVFRTLHSLPRNNIKHLILAADQLYVETSKAMSPNDIMLAMQRVDGSIAERYYFPSFNGDEPGEWLSDEEFRKKLSTFPAFIAEETQACITTPDPSEIQQTGGFVSNITHYDIYFIGTAQEGNSSPRFFHLSGAGSSLNYHDINRMVTLGADYIGKTENVQHLTIHNHDDFHEKWGKFLEKGKIIVTELDPEKVKKGE